MSDNPEGVYGVGLQTAVNRLNTMQQLVASEGDVTRDFDQSIIPPVALAFSGRSALTDVGPNSTLQRGAPILWSRSLVGPTGLASSNKTVDFQMTMPYPSNIEAAAMIGEMKRPSVIIREEWRGEQEASGITKRLQKELRAYAYEYRCPQVFVFDTKSLVVVQFLASSVDDIKSPNCAIDVCVVPRTLDTSITDQCTMQYVLYRLAWKGWVRLCATLNAGQSTSGRLTRVPNSLQLNGYTRKYEYWSGRPVWYDRDGVEHDDHPVGYRSEFIVSNVQRLDGTMEVEASGLNMNSVCFSHISHANTLVQAPS